MVLRSGSTVVMRTGWRPSACPPGGGGGPGGGGPAPGAGGGWWGLGAGRRGAGPPAVDCGCSRSRRGWRGAWRWRWSGWGACWSSLVERACQRLPGHSSIAANRSGGWATLAGAVSVAISATEAVAAWTTTVAMTAALKCPPTQLPAAGANQTAMLGLRHGRSPSSRCGTCGHSEAGPIDPRVHTGGIGEQLLQLPSVTKLR